MDIFLMRDWWAKANSFIENVLIVEFE